MGFVGTRRNIKLCTATMMTATVALAGPAAAQTANVSVATTNVLNLLSPFLSLNATAIGQQTLQTDLSQAEAINQNTASVALLNGNKSTAALAALSISDENLLGSASNTVYGLPTSVTYGVAANLAGGLPTQNTTAFGTLYNGQQPVGAFGAVLGAAYVRDVGSAGSSVTLPNTVTLLTTAFQFTGNSTATGDSQVAKFYFANGTINGTTAAVAPTGSTLPTYNGLPNTTNSVYDTAFGVTNKQSGQNAYGDSHPYQTQTGPYTLYDPTVKTAYTGTAASGLVVDKPSSNPSFPSSHEAYAETDSVLLGMLVPQLYQSMLLRASEMGESRIVVGVHYPTDIIASRAFAAYDLANYLSNPAYINNAAVTGTAVNLPSLFTAAQPEIQTQLTAAAAAANCGTSLATCATSATNANPYAPSTTNTQIYQARLTYGLPTLTFAQAPREQAPAGSPDASILLATVYGGGTAAAQTLAPNGGMDGNLSTSTINQIIVNTETNALAAFYGTSLSYWSRIDLYDAIGYFSAVTGTLTLASGDQVNENVTIAGTTTNVNGDVVPAGVLRGVGATITGNVETQAGGTIAPGAAAETAGGQLAVKGNVTFDAGSNFATQGFLNNGTATTDNLAISGGNLSIANGAQLTLSGLYVPGVKYSLIQLASGGAVSGAFSGVAIDPAAAQTTLMGFLTPQLQYGAGSGVTLQLQANLALAAQTPNQRAVANAIDAAANAGGVGPNGVSLLATLIANNTAASAPAVFNTLSGAGLAEAKGAALRTGGEVAESISDEAFFGLLGSGPDTTGVSHVPPASALGYAAGAPMKSPILVNDPPPAPERDWRSWGVFLGGGGRIAANAGQGSPGASSSRYGGVAGLDYRVQPNWLIGFALGGSDTRFNVKALGTAGDVTGFHGGLYTAYALGQGYYAELMESFGVYNNSTTRAAGGGLATGTLSASFNSFEARTRLEFGRSMDIQGYSVTPFIAGEFASLQTNAFTETSYTPASVLALASKAQNTISAPIFLGYKWTGSSTMLPGLKATPYLDLAWVHEFSPDRKESASIVSLPGSDFTVYGPRAASDLAQVKAGLKMAVAKGVTAFIAFNGELSPSASYYGGKAGITYSW